MAALQRRCHHLLPEYRGAKQRRLASQREGSKAALAPSFRLSRRFSARHRERKSLISTFTTVFSLDKSSISSMKLLLKTAYSAEW
jgi:hypothetical protein